MKTRSIEQQISNLRPAVTSGFALIMHKWLLASAIVLVILSIYLWHPVPLMIAAFLGLVGFAERHTGSNIVAAIKAYDMSSPTAGEVSITISCGDTDQYHALIRECGQSDWEYEFIPQGWKPAEGIYAVHIWRVGNDGPPALAAVETGILIPRYKPKQPGSTKG